MIARTNIAATLKTWQFVTKTITTLDSLDKHITLFAHLLRAPPTDEGKLSHSYPTETKSKQDTPELVDPDLRGTATSTNVLYSSSAHRVSYHKYGVQSWQKTRCYTSTNTSCMIANHMIMSSCQYTNISHAISSRTTRILAEKGWARAGPYKHAWTRRLWV